MLLLTFRVCRRNESPEQDEDVMNSPKEQSWTSDRKCDEAQKPPSAYQTDDFRLSDVVLALSTTVGLNYNAGSRRGGQVAEKYSDNVYLMHTKSSVLHCVRFLPFTRSACISPSRCRCFSDLPD